MPDFHAVFDIARPWSRVRMPEATRLTLGDDDILSRVDFSPLTLTISDDQFTTSGEWVSVTGLQTVQMHFHMHVSLASSLTSTKNSMTSLPITSAFVGYSMLHGTPVLARPPKRPRSNPRSRPIYEYGHFHSPESFPDIPSMAQFKCWGTNTIAGARVVLHETASVPGNLRAISQQVSFTRDEFDPWAPTGPVNSDDLLQTSTATYNAISRGDPAVPLARIHSAASIPEGADFAISEAARAGTATLLSYFQFEVPPLGVLSFPSELDEMLAAFARNCRVKLSITGLRHALLQWVHIQDDDNHCRERGWTDNRAPPMPAVPLAKFLVNFEQWLRWHEEARLVAYIHPYRWINHHGIGCDLEVGDEAAIRQQVARITPVVDGFTVHTTVTMLPCMMPGSAINQALDGTPFSHVSRKMIALLAFLPVPLLGMPIFATRTWPIMMHKDWLRFFHPMANVTSVADGSRFPIACLSGAISGTEDHPEPEGVRQPRLLSTVEQVTASIWESAIDVTDPHSDGLRVRRVVADAEIGHPGDGPRGEHVDLGNLDPVQSPPAANHDTDALLEDAADAIRDLGVEHFLGPGIRRGVARMANEQIADMVRLRLLVMHPDFPISMDNNLRLTGPDSRIPAHMSAEDLARYVVTVDGSLNPEAVRMDRPQIMEAVRRVDDMPGPCHRCWALLSGQLKEWADSPMLGTATLVTTNKAIEEVRHALGVLEGDADMLAQAVDSYDPAHPRPIPVDMGMFAGTVTSMVPFVVRTIPRLLARLYGIEVVSENTSLGELLREWDEVLRPPIMGLPGLIASQAVEHIKVWRRHGWESDAGYDALRQMMASLDLLMQAYEGGQNQQRYAEEVLVPYFEGLSG